jgi:hypothetical protein
MCRRAIAIFSIAAVSINFAAGALQTATSPRAFQIVTRNLPLPEARNRYEVELKAVGGQPPYHWSILSNPLPPGLALDSERGVIFGRPQSSGGFSVLVQVADSSQPPRTISRLLVAAADAPLTVKWTAAPQVSGSNISGAARVSNGTKDDVNLTLIVVAVNELGKAFTLRYEHLILARGTETPDLKFDVSLPIGRYMLHADAVGEVPGKNVIYRDRRELEGLLVQAQ